MKKKKIIDFIERIKAEEYEMFGKSDKNVESNYLIAKISQHSGFQMACDAIIQEIKEL